MKFYKKKKTALVLGGGAARGFAHLGILKVLRMENVKFDLVLGTSIGALFSAAWALGVDLAKIEKLASDLTTRDILDFTIARTGLCKGNKLEHLIRESLQGLSFKDVKIPLYIVTTNIETGQPVLHESGDLTAVIRASCAIPGVFMPVEIDGQIMVDGGITNNVPVLFAKKLRATHVVAVDAGYCVKKGGMNNMVNIIFQSIQIMGQRLNQYETRRADLVLRPRLDQVNQTEFDRAGEIIRAGQYVAERYIKKVKKLTDRGPLGMGVRSLWE